MVTNHCVLYVGGRDPDRLRSVGILESREFTVHTSNTARDGLLRLHTESVDCVVCDGSPPDMPLQQFQDLVAEEAPTVPVLVVGDLDDNWTNVFSGGVSIEYVPNGEGLADAIEQSIARGQMVDVVNQHQTLISCVNTIAREVVETKSPDAIRRLVHDHIITLDRCQFAWVGSYDEDDDRINFHIPTESTMTPNQFAELVGATEPDFISQAAENRTVVTTKGSTTTRKTSATAMDPPGAFVPVDRETRQPRLEIVAVPFVYEETVYGILLLLLSPTDEEALPSSERELLAGLGRLVGWGFAALDAKEGLDAGSFADIIVHELVNPLSVAKNALEMTSGTDDNEQLVRAERALDRIEHVLTDELSLFRGEDVETQTFGDIASDAERAWASLDADRADLDVEGSFDIRADHALVESLLTNLFDNALKYAGESVNIRIGKLSDGFYIVDDGPGIPDEVKPHVFEFGFTSGTGTGLGLAVVKQIVDAHGWNIRLTDGEQEGTRFEITGVETRRSSSKDS